MTTIILCGGAGTRLWPLSRQAFPKQFCDLLGGPSLFERTVERNAALSSGFIIVTNRAHEATAAEQFRSAAPAGMPASFILEPCGRNTAPAIALACLGLDPEELVLVVPSDHVIRDEEAYRRAVGQALKAAAAGKLVTFGLKPEYPETGYGYIEAAEEDMGGYRPVRSFKEKPDRETAEGYVVSGRFFWNSGMFLFSAGAYLEELGKSAPAMLSAARAALAGAARRGGAESPRIEVAEPAMRAIPADSIDYAVMEKSARVAVVPCSLGWSDLGSWDAIYEAREKDEAGNAAGFELLALDARGNLAIGSGRPIALLGVENLLVVDAGDAILVTRRGSSQDVKKIVEFLKAKGKTTLL